MTSYYHREVICTAATYDFLLPLISPTPVPSPWRLAGGGEIFLSRRSFSLKIHIYHNNSINNMNVSFQRNRTSGTQLSTTGRFGHGRRPVVESCVPAIRIKNPSIYIGISYIR